MIDLKEAINLAMRSPHPKHRHCCIILKDNQLVSFATNTPKGHAEARALEVWKLSQTPEDRSRSHQWGNVSLISIAIDKAGRLKLAKPCKRCQAKINRSGIVYVYHSTKDQRIIKL